MLRELIKETRLLQIKKHRIYSQLFASMAAIAEQKDYKKTATVLQALTENHHATALILDKHSDKLLQGIFIYADGLHLITNNFIQGTKGNPATTNKEIIEMMLEL